MTNDALFRLSIACVCLAGLAGLCVHYDAIEEERSPYPTTEALDEEYDAHVGDRALLIGEVRAIDDGEMRIAVTASGDAEIAMTVDEAPDDVAPGGVVQVYGELRPDQSMAADEVVVVNADSGDERYKLGVSIVGLLVAAGYFLRHWRLSLSALGWEARSDG